MDLKEKVEIVKRELKRSWIPFFGGFGNLNETQLVTIPKVLEKKSVVLTSPTASGKTEAIVAPIAELLFRERQEGLSTIYIVPTKALANDIFLRLKGPLDDMKIKVNLKHGDKPYISESKPPNFLITTPESLDSIICRSKGILKYVSYLILDEIHMLDNTYRGDQLRVLVQRLKRISKNNLIIHMLSATLQNPEELGSRYVDQYEVVKISGNREIESYIFSDLKELVSEAIKKKWKKILVFCNLRQDVEKVTSQLQELWKPYPVVAHHGSLSRSLRNEAEEVMKHSPCAICVATSTLEVGIDIGDIDVVVFYELPLSQSSFLQRIGRGSRRTDKTKIAAITKSLDEQALFEEMVDLARKGVLIEDEYYFDLSVAVQQILSYLFENPQGADKKEVFEILSSFASEQEVESILHELFKRGFVEYFGKKVYASIKTMDMGEKGKLHTNIPDEIEFFVYHSESGTLIGKVSETPDSIFALGGKLWKVLRIDFKQKIILAKPCKGKAEAPIFQRRKNLGKYFYLLPKEIKEKMLEIANSNLKFTPENKTDLIF
ncbi:MAG: DEAD/DEAH box helicase [Candidatus Aenigmatarchaeota archaeon]